MVPGLKSLPYEERLDRLGIWTLEERRNRADLLQVFKLYKGWSSAQFGHFFTISTVTNTRGHTAKIDKPRCHLDLRRSFFSHCVIYRQMERTTTKRHRLWYNQHFQELAQQVEEESDGLLHGPAGPPGPMAYSALKNSEEQVRPHLVSKLVSW